MLVFGFIATLAPSVVLAAPLGFEAALDRGIVDLMFNPWSKRSDAPLIAATIALKPGLVNRLGFAYGGPTRFWLDQLAAVARTLRVGLPDVRLGGGFPEVVAAGYDEALPCDADAPPRAFDAKAMTRVSTGDGKAAWLDLGRPEAIAFYGCIGKILVRQGFSHFHFEQGMTTVRQAASPEAALAGLRRLQAELSAYAAKEGTALSFSGDPELARHIRLDAVYMPSRFYTNSFATEDRDRIALPDPPGGYTYALSPRIVHDTATALPKGVTAMFYVDNFDASQDDLRRLMELPAEARRRLVLRSSRTAADARAVFIPSLNHCEGCIPRAVVVDACEIVADGSLTEYDAAACGDVGTIGEALAIQRAAAASSR